MKKIIKFSTVFILVIILFLTSLMHLSYANELEEETLETETIKQEVAIETSSDPSSIPTINARSAIVLDRVSLKTIYGKEEHKRVKMASTTKIMTAIVVIEHSDLTQQVEVSKKAAGTGGSRLGLKTGDKVTIGDLLYGLMLCSGNDSAVALAESIAGSVPEFSVMMNQKAKALHLENTNFESPHGLDSDEHYTTPYELAMLTDYALKNKTFLDIASTKTYTVTLNGTPKNISNTNELLGNLNGVYGVKTGFTNGANRCLVSACKRDNMDIICIVLGADTKNFRTKDSIKLIEYAFRNYTYVDLKEKIDTALTNWNAKNRNNFDISKGISNQLDIKLSEFSDTIIPVKKELVNDVAITIDMNQQFTSPIAENDILGNLTVTIGDEHYTTLDILSASTIRKKNVFSYFFEILKDYNQIITNL